MKLVAALAAAGMIAATAIGVRVLGVWGDESFEGGIDPPSLQLGFLGIATDRPLGELEDSGSACQRLASLSAGLGKRESTPSGFLRALGLAAAGIRPPPRALADLARGGRDLIPGGGFRAAYSDGTTGQVRHFAGVAVASVYGGAAATRLASVFLRRDPVRSADGRLSERALDFVALVESGELPPEQAGAWILENICRPTGLGAGLAGPVEG
jgi:hypothetical protein